MSDLKKFLTPQGAQALRDFAADMPVAIENIRRRTDILINVYCSTAEDLGEHSDSFGEMLDYVRKAQEKAAEAIQELSKGLELTASKIDAYLAKNLMLHTSTAKVEHIDYAIEETQKYRAIRNNNGAPATFLNVTRKDEKKCDIILRTKAHELLNQTPFSCEIWQNSSAAKKKKTISTLVDKLNNILSTTVSTEIVYYYAETNSRAAYNAQTNEVLINEYFLEKTSSYQILQSIIHEMRHAYQHYAIKNPNEVTVSQQTIDIWTENIKNYKDFQKGYSYEEYVSQPIEWDAKNFAKQRADIYDVTPNYLGSWDAIEREG